MNRSAVLLSAFIGLSSASAVMGQAYTVVHSFVHDSGGPYGGLTKGPGNTLYGVATGGGFWGQGSVFSLTPDGLGGFTFASLYSFTGGQDGAGPEAALVLANDGNFYGTTFTGYGAKGGTVFRVDASGNLETLHQFFGFGDDGYNPLSSLIQGSDGNLYGVTYAGGAFGYGNIFRVTLAGDYETLHSFEGGDQGAHPICALVEGPDGKFYGTTSDGGALGGVGTIFRIGPDRVFESLHAFTASDGANPNAGMIFGPNGLLYGTTLYGGDFDRGTVFQSDLSGNVTSYPLYPLSVVDGPYAPLVLADDGNLYGTTLTTVYRFTTAGELTALHTFTGPDGTYVRAALIQGNDGALYGTTVLGALGFGSVFRLDTSGANFETVYPFSGGGAWNPSFPLFPGPDGSIYGTAGGGKYGLGSVFRLDPTGSETVLHSFSGPDGSFPLGLVRTTDGDLFGTATGGGPADLGTVFEIANGGTFSILHSFDATEGAPLGLTLGSDGSLVGATYSTLPPSVPGTLFRIDPVGTFSILYFFSGPDGQFPTGDFLETDSGTFLGTADSGGLSNLGTVYEFDISGGFTLLHSFEGWEGAHPSGQLVKAPDGNYYGLARQGGAFGFGTIYRLDAKGRPTLLHSFDGTDGLSPVLGLALADDGYLYGATQFGGPFHQGSVFRSDGAGNLVVLHSLEGADGSEPNSQVFQGTDTGLYGAASRGGLFGGGVVFRVSLPAGLSVWGISPSSGDASGGTNVEITGFNFFNVGSAVTIGGVPAANVVTVDPHLLTATTPALTPGTLNDVAVTDILSLVSGTLKDGWLADFLDAPQSDPFHGAIEKIFRLAVTAGYGNGYYGISDPVTRAQMAVFLLKGEHGTGYTPPPCSGIFVDVPCLPTPVFAVDWIEQLSRENITAGCSDAVHYCPDDPISRAQMAVFLLKAKHGSTFVPPACGGIFLDVPCPSTPEFPYSDWVEELFNEQITAGCGNSMHFCPDDPVTRGQMAVFLVLTFGL